MMSAVKFVFGSGWWIAWHAVLLVSLLPLWAVMDWLRTMQPGKGPQGGEAIFIFLLLVLMIVLGASLVNGLMWSGAQPWSWARRYLLFPLGLIIVLGVASWVIFSFANTITIAETAPSTRTLMWWGVVAVFAVLYLANLGAMAAVRAARAAV